MLHHPLTNFEIWKYDLNEPAFNIVYSRNDSSRIKNGIYVINIEYESMGTHWLALYVNGINVTYFERLGIECIPKEIKSL